MTGIFLFCICCCLKIAWCQPPRCKVPGFYQYRRLIWACQGSGGSSSQNQVEVLIQARASWQEDVPPGTTNLVISVDSPVSVDAALWDPLTLQSLKEPVYKRVPIKYLNSTSPHQKIIMSGITPNRLTLQIRNRAGVPAVIKIGYMYDAYKSNQRQCQNGAQPLGCASYDQYKVRDVVSDWSCWLGQNFSSTDAAWRYLALPSVLGLGVPAFSWRNVWRKWQPAPDDFTSMAPYKFVTQGGVEFGIQQAYKSNFVWAANSCTMRDFLIVCCKRIRSQFSSSSDAWTQWVGKGKDNAPLSASTYGPWEVCKDMQPSGISKIDFLEFLDADGFGGPRRGDLDVCWQARSIVNGTLAGGRSIRPALPKGTTSSGSASSGSPEQKSPSFAQTIATWLNLSPKVPPPAPVTTYLMKPVPQGSLVLPLASYSGIKLGSKVLIGKGTRFYEENRIIGLMPLTLQVPLSYPHKSGTSAMLLPPRPPPPAPTLPPIDSQVQKSSVYAGIAGGIALLAGTGVAIEASMQSQKSSVTPGTNQSQLQPGTNSSQSNASGIALNAAGAATLPVSLQNTSLTGSVRAGALVLPVAATNGFSIGGQVVIDPGTNISEVNTIISFGSIVVKNPLQFNHSLGAVVTTSGATSTSPGGPATVLAILVPCGLTIVAALLLGLCAYCRNVKSSSTTRSVYPESEASMSCANSSEYDSEHEEAPLLSTERSNVPASCV